MTDAEKKQAQEMLARKQAGWKFLEEERKLRIRETNTAEAIMSLQSAFEYSQTLPPRLESGFVEFYKRLGVVKPK